MIFELKGTYKEKGFNKNFTRNIEAISEKRAKEIAYSLIGSEHRVARKTIAIESVTKVKEEK